MSPRLIASITVTTGLNNNPMHFWSDHCGVASLNHDGSVHSDSVVKDKMHTYLRDTLTQLL